MDKVTIFQCNANVAHHVHSGFVFLPESDKTACRDIFHAKHIQLFGLCNLLIGVSAEYHTCLLYTSLRGVAILVCAFATVEKTPERIC